MRVDVNGVGLEVDVDGQRAARGAAARLARLRPAVAPPGRRARRRRLPRESCPTCAASAAPTSPAERRHLRPAVPRRRRARRARPLGVERAHVVGHDWGAALAWALGRVRPRPGRPSGRPVRRPPGGVRDAGFAQREKSWYMLLFQFEGVAEQWLSPTTGPTSGRGRSHPDADAVDRRARRDPASLTAGPQLVPGQRARRSRCRTPARAPAGAAPTMGVWSSGDSRYRGADDRSGGARRPVLALRAPRRRRPLDAARAAGRVNALLLDFLPAP